jgi:RNA polymerase sigma-70 factor, ECF subfamily
LAVPTESELLHRARQGDAAAFKALIRGHDKHLYRVARSVLLDDQEAEDAVQETYVRVFTACEIFARLPACEPGSLALF